MDSLAKWRVARRELPNKRTRSFSILRGGHGGDKFDDRADTNTGASRNRTTPGGPLNGRSSRPISERNHLSVIKKKSAEERDEGENRARMR